MNSQETKKLFLQALNEQLESISVVNQQIIRHQKESTDLEIRQYRHLRDEYIRQLAELMEGMPDSMKLEVVEHQPA